MQMTQFSDFALRTLLYLHQKPEGKTRASIAGIARYHGISKHHLVRVAARLRDLGYIRMIRGRLGGIELAVAARSIVIGQVVRQTEPDFHLVECFNQEQNRCVISQHCQLKAALYLARNAFLEVLDQYTLATVGKKGLKELPLPRKRSVKKKQSKSSDAAPIHKDLASHHRLTDVTTGGDRVSQPDVTPDG